MSLVWELVLMSKVLDLPGCRRERLTRQKEDDDELASSCECEHDPEDISPSHILRDKGADDCCVRNVVSFCYQARASPEKLTYVQWMAQ